MLILVNQYSVLWTVVFDVAKGLNGQNHSSSNPSIKNKNPPSKISNHPQPNWERDFFATLKLHQLSFADHLQNI